MGSKNAIFQFNAQVNFQKFAKLIFNYFRKLFMKKNIFLNNFFNIFRKKDNGFLNEQKNWIKY